MGENLLRNLPRFSDSGNVCLRFYGFAGSENVQEMRRNPEPHCCTSALLRAASRILIREQSFIFLTLHYSSRAIIQHPNVKVDITALAR